MDKTPPIIEFDAITKAYGGLPVLDGFSLAIREGEFLTLLGPSGCGKTTLLRLLAGFEAPDRGEIRIDGQCVNALPPERRPVNTVFQSYALFPHLSVADNVGFGLRMKNAAPAAIRAQVDAALAAVRLDGCGGRLPRQLSGGQQQRVALARALVNRPRALLLDEPLSALDLALRCAMQVELKALQRQLGIAFVFVTHDQEEALSLSDRVVVLRGGVVEQIGGPEAIYQRPASRFVAEFVGEGNALDAVLSARLDGVSAFAVVEGVACTVRGAAGIAPGAAFALLLRPEDLLLVESTAPEARLQGTVAETVYKGMTVDTVVELDNGKRLRACAVFGAGQPFRPGQRVGLAWAAGRERVLR
ncbi:MAG: polyamine ABC transporter ATP-binding protein [Candidatus Methylumidiphilus sp.]